MTDRIGGQPPSTAPEDRCRCGRVTLAPFTGVHVEITNEGTRDHTRERCRFEPLHGGASPRLVSTNPANPVLVSGSPIEQAVAVLHKLADRVPAEAEGLTIQPSDDGRSTVITVRWK